MEKFTTLRGVAAPLPMVNVDTDMIIPKNFLKTIKRTGLKEGLFYEMRWTAEAWQIARSLRVRREVPLRTIGGEEVPAVDVQRDRELGTRVRDGVDRVFPEHEHIARWKLPAAG